MEGQASPVEADIARRTWLSLERSQMLPTLAQSAQGAIESGVVAELETVEVPAETYPTTTAFVRLIASLVHRRSPLSNIEMPPQGALERFNVVAPSSEKSIPEGLGSPQRRPGIGPYITFVLDNVFLGLNKRRFRIENERWPLALACLNTILRCLGNFDESADNLGKLSRSCADPATQAGLDMLIRLLSHTETLAAIVAIASTPLDTVESLQASSVMCDSIQAALSILKILFDVQIIFLSVTLPIVLEHSSRLLLTSTYNNLRSVQSLGDSLLAIPDISHSLPRIATLVNSSDRKLQVGAIQLLNAIALSRDFSVTDSHSTMLQPHARINRLVGFIDSSDESDRICHGFTSLMRSSSSHDSAAQSEVLNLLISSASGEVAAPNVAHYLLGYSFRQEDKNSVDVDDDTSRSCLHGVVDMVLATIASDAPFTTAEHCLHLLVLLARQEATAESTLRFLRTQYDFATQLVAALPFSLAASSIQHGAELEITMDGASFSTSSAIPATVLRAQAWAQQLLMLEANDLALLGQKDRLRRLMTSMLTFDGRASSDDVSNQDEHQAPILLEVSNALGFQWHDMRQPEQVPLQFFGNLSFDTCLVEERSGEGSYSLGLVIDILAIRRHEIQVKGGLQSADQQSKAQSEIRSILDHLEIQNTRLAIVFAQQQALEAWSNLVITLLLLPKDALGEPTVPVPSSDLLLSALSLVSQMQDRPSSLEILFEATFMIVSFVRERQLQDHTSSNEQLIDSTTVLFDLLSSTDLSPKARGMLCSTLITSLRILLPTEIPSATPKQAGPSSRAIIIISSIQTNLHRLLEILCNDAISGNDVWQIASLNLLEAIYACALQASSSDKMLQIMVKQNLLNRLAASIQNSQGAIRGFLMSEACTLTKLLGRSADTKKLRSTLPMCLRQRCPC